MSENNGQRDLGWVVKTVGPWAAGIASLLKSIVEVKNLISGQPNWFWLLVSVVALIGFCCFIWFKRENVGARFGISGHSQPQYPKWARRTCAGVVCSIVIIGFFAWLLQHRTIDTFRILVAEIDGPDRGVTGTFIEKLRKETSMDQDIAIIPLKRRISIQEGSSAAANILTKEDADLLIWGRNPDASDYITLHFELKGPELRAIASQDGVTQLVPDGRIGSHSFQQKLSSDVSAFALFVVACAKMHKNDYTRALPLFEQIVAKGIPASGFFTNTDMLSV